MKTIPKLWQLWNNGCIEKDLLPVKTYINPSKRKEDFDADRFRRWRHLAAYIEQKAQLSSVSRESVVADLQAKMHDMGLTIPKFVKEALPALQKEARYLSSISPPVLMPLCIIYLQNAWLMSGSLHSNSVYRPH